MDYREAPWSDMKTAWAIEGAVRNGTRPPLDKVHIDRRALIVSCWDQDPDKRPTFATIVDELQQLMAALMPSGLNRTQSGVKLNTSR